MRRERSERREVMGAGGEMQVEGDTCSGKIVFEMKRRLPGGRRETTGKDFSAQVQRGDRCVNWPERLR